MKVQLFCPSFCSNAPPLPRFLEKNRKQLEKLINKNLDITSCLKGQENK